MRVALGVMMGILVMVGMIKSAYDRYFHNRFKSTLKPVVAPSAGIENPLSHADWRVRADALAHTEPIPDNIERLLPLLGDNDYDIRMTTRDKLVQVGSPALTSLLNILQAGSADERQTAAEALGQIGDKAAVDSLLQAAKDENKWVRLAVVEALGFFKSQTVQAALAHILESDNDAQVREAAQNALS